MPPSLRDVPGSTGNASTLLPHRSCGYVGFSHRKSASSTVRLTWLVLSMPDKPAAAVTWGEAVLPS